MASTTDGNPANQELADVNVGELLKTRLENSLPRVLWVPIFYGACVPVAVVGGFLWMVFWAGMPWTGFGG